MGTCSHVNAAKAVGDFFCSRLKESHVQILNALVEKIEILTPAHFVFEMKSEMRLEEMANYYR